MQIQDYAIKDIVIGERQRQDLGDIQGLADDIKLNGQIQPVGVNEDGKIIWGRRRLAACTLLGQLTIKAIVRTGLTPVQEQMLEWSEDLRQKPRDWREKCTATAKIFNMMKVESLEQGEKWGYREMASWTGDSTGTISYMLAIAEELTKEPEGDVAKCDSYYAAIKILAQRRLREATQELERRRMLKPPMNIQTIPKTSSDFVPDPDGDYEVTPEGALSFVQALNETRIKIYAVKQADDIMPCKLVLTWVEFPAIDCLKAAGCPFVVWAEPFEYTNMEETYGNIEGFDSKLRPLIWNHPNEFLGHRLFGCDYHMGCVVTPRGYVMEEIAQPPSAVVVANTEESGQLPLSVISYLLSALTQPDDLVLCLGQIDPINIACMGRVPVFFDGADEPRRKELAAWYMANVPGVVIV